MSQFTPFGVLHDQPWLKKTKSLEKGFGGSSNQASRMFLMTVFLPIVIQAHVII